VIAAGFEPATVCLEGRCSIQLSYATEIEAQRYI
jgi:site-specific DNA recombinase